MAKNKAKIVIGMPVTEGGSMRGRTAHSVGVAIIHAGDMVVDYLMRLSCDIVSARTWLVNESLKQGATHILFVDSDMLFPGDIIEKLLAHDKEIVGVQYNKRKFPLEPTYTPLEEKSETELYKAKYAGTGLLLVKLSIFKDMKGPWFNFGRDSQGELVLGEDVWFCNTARDSGFDTWIDPTIQVYHLGEYGY